MTRPFAYTVRSLIHRYDGATVLDIPALDLAAGKIYGLLGPNGSGKTTLLQILALLLKPTSGAVAVNGTDISSAGAVETIRRQVTLIHQNPVLFSTTVYKNLAFGLKARGIARSEISRKIAETMSQMGLEGFEKRRARKLSGGEAQRVVLARAMLLDTPILLLDEPTSFLDLNFRPLLVEWIRKKNESAGVTILFATHDIAFASFLAHEIIHLERGALVKIDSR